MEFIYIASLYFGSNQPESLKNLRERHIQNPLKHVRWSFLRKNSRRLSAFNYFLEKQYLTY